MNCYGRDRISKIKTLGVSAGHSPEVGIESSNHHLSGKLLPTNDIAPSQVNAGHSLGTHPDPRALFDVPRKKKPGRVNAGHSPGAGLYYEGSFDVIRQPKPRRVNAGHSLGTRPDPEDVFVG